MQIEIFIVYIILLIGIYIYVASNKLNEFIKNTNICEFALANILHKSFDHMNIKVQHNNYTSLFNETLITFLFTEVP